MLTDLLRDHQKAPTSNLNLSNEVTIVTAYINIGQFQKGESQFSIFTPQLYRKWMGIFGKITNPVVAYFNDESYYLYFKELRSQESSQSKAVLLHRDELWSFAIRDNISDIYNQSGYPVHHPNTVIPEYPCAMHAKYELMLKSIQLNPFGTKYFAWLDIGLFREINTKDQDPFQIHLPPDFNQSKVAYAEVYNFNRYSQLSDEQIFLSNSVWVCGCFFLGRIDIMETWTKEYLRHVDYFLGQRLMNTDQQVIYAVHKNHRPVTVIQTYSEDSNDRRFNKWFYLGYLCKA